MITMMLVLHQYSTFSRNLFFVRVGTVYNSHRTAARAPLLTRMRAQELDQKDRESLGSQENLLERMDEMCDMLQRQDAALALQARRAACLCASLAPGMRIALRIKVCST